MKEDKKHIRLMEKTLSELQQAALEGYLLSTTNWDAYSSVQALAIQMDNELSNVKDYINHPRFVALIQALETASVGTSDEVKVLIKRLESTRVKMIYRPNSGRSHAKSKQ